MAAFTMVSPELLIGIFGSLLLVVAWVWETYEHYRKHNISVHMHFAILYITGNIALAFYSWKINSSVFFILSLILIAAIISEIIGSMCLVKKKAKNYGKNRKRR